MSSRHVTLPAWRRSIVKLSFLLLVLAPGPGPTQPPETTVLRYECRTSQGIPATVAIISSGESRPIINWPADTFTLDARKLLHLCEAATKKLNEVKDSHHYITTSRINGKPVICAVRAIGDTCATILATLKSSQNPNTILRKISSKNTQQILTGPLKETGDTVFIDLNSQTFGLGYDKLCRPPHCPERAKDEVLLQW
jgi:hypothetical protein